MNTILNKITLFSLRTQVTNDCAHMNQKESVRIAAVLKNCQFVIADNLFTLSVEDDTGGDEKHYTITIDRLLDMTITVSSPDAQKSLYFQINSTTITEPRDMYILVYMAINRLNDMEVVMKYDGDLSQKITEKLDHIKSMRSLNEERWF